jgi:hypothetical protein
LEPPAPSINDVAAPTDTAIAPECETDPDVRHRMNSAAACEHNLQHGFIDGYDSEEWLASGWPPKRSSTSISGMYQPRTSAERAGGGAFRPPRSLPADGLVSPVTQASFNIGAVGRIRCRGIENGAEQRSRRTGGGADTGAAACCARDGAADCTGGGTDRRAATGVACDVADLPAGRLGACCDCGGVTFRDCGIPPRRRPAARVKHGAIARAGSEQQTQWQRPHGTR